MVMVLSYGAGVEKGKWKNWIEDSKVGVKVYPVPGPASFPR